MVDMRHQTVSVEITTDSGHSIEAWLQVPDALGLLTVTISQDGHYAGEGRWLIGRGIVNCAARLGAADGSETEAAYEMLEDALLDAIDEAGVSFDLDEGDGRYVQQEIGYADRWE
jgi:hypothetical protein